MMGYVVPIASALAACGLIYAAALVAGLRKRRVDIWWRDYWRHLRARASLARPTGPVHVMFCFVDHFEPRWMDADYATEVRRVERWVRDYPTLCGPHMDADGRPPQHTFFYPSEEYRAEHLDDLCRLCEAGFGEIEVHLHHDDDDEPGLRANLSQFLGRLEDHGAVPLDPRTGRPRWSFIHGNWALDNSSGNGRWCGVNNELQILRDMGCYADFTLPSAPSDTQTSTVNSIYYATDDPHRPKSHDRGTPMRVGGRPEGDLLIMQGPLGLRWKLRSFVPVPAIENADVRASNPPTPRRIDTWIRTHIHVQGRPDWVFVKVHTHGTQERDTDVLLGPPVERMFDHLENRYNDGEKYILHYVTAREMYNIARAAEAGLRGNPGAHRDYVIPRPTFQGAAVPAARARP
jgi:hypothetical protein